MGLNLNTPQTKNYTGLNPVRSGSTTEPDYNVKYVPQTLTEAQQAQARQNIGAAAAGETGGATINEFVYTRTGEPEAYVGTISCQGYEPQEGDLMTISFQGPFYTSYNPITLNNGTTNPTMTLLNAEVNTTDYDEINPEVNTKWTVRLEKVNDAWVAVNISTQVQADWNTSDTTMPSYIKNKPTIPSGGSSEFDYNAANILRYRSNGGRGFNARISGVSSTITAEEIANLNRFRYCGYAPTASEITITGSGSNYADFTYACSSEHQLGNDREIAYLHVTPEIGNISNFSYNASYGINVRLAILNNRSQNTPLSFLGGYNTKIKINTGNFSGYNLTGTNLNNVTYYINNLSYRNFTPENHPSSYTNTTIVFLPDVDFTSKTWPNEYQYTRVNHVKVLKSSWTTFETAVRNSMTTDADAFLQKCTTYDGVTYDGFVYEEYTDNTLSHDVDELYYKSTYPRRLTIYTNVNNTIYFDSSCKIGCVIQNGNVVARDPENLNQVNLVPGKNVLYANDFYDGGLTEIVTGEYYYMYYETDTFNSLFNKTNNNVNLIYLNYVSNSYWAYPPVGTLYLTKDIYVQGLDYAGSNVTLVLPDTSYNNLTYIGSEDAERFPAAVYVPASRYSEFSDRMTYLWVTKETEEGRTPHPEIVTAVLALTIKYDYIDFTNGIPRMVLTATE